jgi:hypothetical protein
MHSGDFPTLAQMLEGNKAWADETEQRYPGMVSRVIFSCYSWDTVCA